MTETESLSTRETRGSDSGYLSELSNWIDSAKPTERLAFAEDIYHTRANLLYEVSMDPFENEATVIDRRGNTRFINPEGREIAKKRLAEYIQKKVVEFEENPDNKTFKLALGGIVALGELTLLTPRAVHDSVEAAKKDPRAFAGINPKQIDAIISLFTNHSTKVPSGQGKSIPDAVVADVAKVLLKHAQVHNYVNDRFARAEESEQIKKMADVLHLPVFVFPATEDQTGDSSLYNKLISQRTMYLSLNPTQRRTSALQSIERKITAFERAFAYANTWEMLDPPIPDKAPAIAVGTESDFKFAWLRGEHPELFKGNSEAVIDETKRKPSWWTNHREGIDDEGDLRIRADTVSIIESPGINAIESYLPDWIAMAVADRVCIALQKSGDIISVEGSLTFDDEDNDLAQQKYDRRFNRGLKKIQQTGQLPSGLQEALQGKLLALQESIPDDVRLSTQDINRAMMELVKKYAALPDDNNVKAGDYAQAWMQAQTMKEGTEFSAQDNTVAVIDRHTGTQLASHRYQDLLDVAVDVSHGVCMLRGRNEMSQASTGHLSFIDKVYGKKNFAILTATTQGIDGDVEFFLGNPVIEAQRWSGEAVETPDPFMAEAQDDAINFAKQFLEDPEAERQNRPVEIQPNLFVTDSDPEILDLQRELQASLPEGSPIVISVITSKTTVEEEKRIYELAGEKNHITIANPKAGRMIDIKTTKKADELGGLRVIAWGPLYSNDVLYQILQRTKRAGHPGEAAWIVYKHGGHVGLADHKLLSMFPDYVKQMNEIPSGTDFPYEDGLLEQLHVRQFEMTTARRLQIHYEDLTRESLTHHIRDEMMSLFTIIEDNIATLDERILVTPAYIRQLINKYMPYIQEIAHTEARSKSIPTRDALLSTLGDRESHIKKLAIENVTHQFDTDLALELDAVKIDAITTTATWKACHAGLMELTDAKQFKTGNRKTTHAQPKIGIPPLERNLDGSIKLQSELFTQSLTQESFLLPGAPNTLVTMKKLLIRHKQGPDTYQFSFRLTTIKNETVSIDSDTTIPYTCNTRPNGKLYTPDQAYLKQYMSLLMKTLKKQGATKESRKEFKKYLKQNGYSNFNKAQRL